MSEAIKGDKELWDLIVNYYPAFEGETGEENKRSLFEQVSKLIERRLALTNRPKDSCDVCWTSSWAPCTKDTPNSQQIKGKDEWVLCQMCEADRKLINLHPKED